MKTIRNTLVLLVAILFPLFAHAVDEQYSQAKFDALNKAGSPVLVDIYADWCPTCKAQGKILGELLPMDEFKGITVLRVDYDMQKPVVRAFGVRRQSTLIVFKGGKEAGRVIAETDRERIAELLRKAL